MGAKNVDVVFVIDASDSMSPCIESVVSNIGNMLAELGKANFHARLDAVIHNVPGEHVFYIASVNTHMHGGRLTDGLYRDAPQTFFTEDVSVFSDCLKTIKVEGDEDMLLALDCALDFPFGPAKNTQRVVVLLSDEPFETNYQFDLHKDEYEAKASEMIDKIHDRHISLYMVMPSSNIAQTLAEADRADYAILQQGDVGLKSFDFSRFFSQLGKTISVTTAQQSHEKPYKKSIMGQAGFGVAGSYTSIGDSASK